MNKIGLIRESRSDDKRTALVPLHIKKIMQTFPNLIITVQPSEHRCFTNQEYRECGAIVSENLSSCDLILGIKETNCRG